MAHKKGVGSTRNGRDSHSQLVYKHAISTVMPSAPVSLWEGDDEGASADMSADA